LVDRAALYCGEDGASPLKNAAKISGDGPRRKYVLFVAEREKYQAVSRCACHRALKYRALPVLAES